MHKSNKNKKSTQPNTSHQSTSQANTEIPNQEQFEVELCWCVQQFQKALGSGKLNNKQVQDHTKNLNVLMSSTAPVVKKRQVMRLSFGDYREKMALEAKKATKKAANITLKPATPDKKTMFLRKSIFSSSTDNNFRFAFDIKEDGKTEEAASLNKGDEEMSEYVNNSNNFHFVPSNNNFKFNFEIENGS